MSALHNATNGQTSGGLAELSKLFICPLCHRFFNQALELQCGHVFCDSCVDQHFSPNGRKYFSPLPSCPTCNLSTPTCVRSVFLDRVVASLVPPAMPVGTLLSSNLSAASSGSERARLEQLVAARGLTIQFRRTGDLSLQSLVAVECVVSGQRIGTAEGSDEAEAIELLARKIMHTWQGGSAPAPSSILPAPSQSSGAPLSQSPVSPAASFSMSQPRVLFRERAQQQKTDHALETVSMQGPSNTPIITVHALWNGEIIGIGRGSNKKDAENMAAREALSRLDRGVTRLPSLAMPMDSSPSAPLYSSSTAHTLLHRSDDAAAAGPRSLPSAVAMSNSTLLTMVAPDKGFYRQRLNEGRQQLKLLVRFVQGPSEGPPHMPIHRTECYVSSTSDTPFTAAGLRLLQNRSLNVRTVGQGGSLKEAEERAAEAAYAELIRYVNL